ncbi:MAG: group III truncated hemoglobin [Bacteroidia bacterium]
MKRDIENINDIQLMVNTFYERVQQNEVLAPIFEARIGNRWPEHLEKMYRFWETILLNNHTYSGAPFAPHATMPIDNSHFEVWVDVFNGTLADLFEGEVAKEAKARGTLMAALFASKLQYINKQHS